MKPINSPDQGTDSGHAQAQMITEQYAHILQENRVTNAHLMEEAFYRKKEAAPKTAQQSKSDESADEIAGLSDAEVLSRVLGNADLIGRMREMLEKK